MESGTEQVIQQLREEYNWENATTRDFVKAMELLYSERS